jgi:hypothetical protein
MYKFFLIFALYFPLVFAKCPQGAIQGLKSEDCYVYKVKSMRFNQAEEDCKQLNGHLTSILNVFENNFLINQTDLLWASLISDIWIGGTTGNNLNSTQWTWTDGNTWGYTNWASGIKY